MASSSTSDGSNKEVYFSAYDDLSTNIGDSNYQSLVSEDVNETSLIEPLYQEECIILENNLNEYLI